jgi:hypothetical protein
MYLGPHADSVLFAMFESEISASMTPLFLISRLQIVRLKCASRA